MSRYALSSLSWVLIARLRMTLVLGFEPVRTGIAWRKFKYRNLAKLSLNDESYAQVCKQVREKADRVHTDDDFTAWIRAIQKATLLELRPEDPWTDNKDLIQVRRMRAEDLESQVDLPESEHEYEDTLDVIKLPLPIPEEELSDAPQFLFIRPDEYALFKCFGQSRWCILAGNPGISKSWFQWKFILFCYRLDLFDKFSPFKEKLLDGLKTEDKSSTKQEQVIPAESFIPKLIVRTVAGRRSLFFFVGGMKMFYLSGIVERDWTASLMKIQQSYGNLDQAIHQFTTQVLKPKSLLQCLLKKICFMSLTCALVCFLCPVQVNSKFD